ncbi:cell division protein ZipA [Photobacterium proteolyticum]|uniref:Cell division protein ZipA n=1 Tax=Photobacterium proteolyticum TaxID=1903952 RepID=A0A1Q9GMX1_9GAMM|nr:cell division protein ZipA [Photobacterium proteolyticum]OLQ76003.1 cell division protein ZipA [Photobacterium proteolyticum]
MQELRLVLIIVGALAIAALLLHGLWSSRKEKPAKFGEKPLGKLDDASNVDSDGFDQDGVGSVRVVNSEAPEKASRREPELHFGAKIEADPLMESATSDFSSEPALDLPKMSAKPEVQPAATRPEVDSRPLTGEPELQPVEPVVAPQPAVSPEPEILQPQPASPVHVQATAEPELPKQALIDPEEMTVVQPSEQPLHEQTVDEIVPQEPEVAEPTVKVEPVVEEQIIIEPEPEPEPEPELKPDYLVLNIHARNGEALRGTKLFNSLEQNDLYYGENSVYHRHADVAGTGPIIFSVTNMVHPAHFPEGGSDSFETPGIAFYLMLPCPGRPDYNFNQMLQTVQRVADELGADVLDHERAMITPHRINEYREKAKLYTRA